jgi:serine/threonine protein phosphatase 1
VDSLQRSIALAKLLEMDRARTYMPQRNRPMLDKFRQLLSPQSAGPPRIPEGERVYAIGDIHGRLDLFIALAWAIEKDDAARGTSDTTIILLGDLVDRGPDSAFVVRSAREWGKRRKLRYIIGNHEEMFLKSFHKLETLSHFLRFGGWETVMSYGVDRAAFDKAGLGEAQKLMAQAVPRDDLEFINGFEDAIVMGDYLFVHAGIQPGKSLEKQHTQNLRWIREPFLSHPGEFGFVVVHGHTITDDVDVRHNRIGLDTGAFMSGKLTAIGLEGTQRWLISTGEADGQITTSVQEI